MLGKKGVPEMFQGALRGVLKIMRVVIADFLVVTM